MRRIIAIDFDGTLCEHKYPDIGEPYWGVIEAAKREQENGAALILWTCRVGKWLDEAIRACAEWGLHFDAVNTNLPELVEHYYHDSRKVCADEYWDDKAVRVPTDLEREGLIAC